MAKKKLPKKAPVRKHTVYACAVSWQFELGNAMDLEGAMPFYHSLKQLKKERGCEWAECGIVQLEIVEKKLV